MTALRLLLFALLGVATLAPAAYAQDPETVVDTVDDYLKALRKGRIDLGGRDDVGRDSIPRKAGVLPKGTLGTITPERELELLLQVVADLPPTTDTLHAVLQVAAVGYDDERYPTIARTHVVRQLGNLALQRMCQNEAARQLLAAAAGGELRGVDRKQKDAVQGAALRALPSCEGLPALEIAVAGLQAAGGEARRGAADALIPLGTPAQLPALAAAIAKEDHGGAMRSLAGAGKAILVRGADLSEADKAPLCDAAIRALGRTAWRADSDLIDLLTAARSSHAIDALIGVLERFQADKRKGIKDGSMSGLLKQRAHEALIELTGTLLPADDPARWRDWWAEAKDGFQVAERAERPAEGDAQTSSGFFGIPVHGTRVVFVIDVSLSMEAKMPHTGTAAGGPKPTRLDVAREECWNAAERLDPDAFFNLVLFSEGARAWQKKLVVANSGNLKKLRRFLDELEPEPYTNLWAGMQFAMEFEKGSNAAGDEFQLDEIFVLSDGAPTIGELTDPTEILNVILAENRHKEVRINTVFLKGEGSTMDPEDTPGMGPEELMKEIAERTGGRFVRR